MSYLNRGQTPRVRSLSPLISPPAFVFTEILAANTSYDLYYIIACCVSVVGTETGNPRRPVTPTTAVGFPQHRRRPDIPTVKWRPVDPSVFEACKELRVPVGNNDKRLSSDDEAETKPSAE
ncbi:Hypothetical protein CINCED_3A014994 [Cinara cedri]|uniref:Uncharacterized protein n=1 Tax=Cinara cedri TaxID=506608 RepID=A0A5E4NDP3_9HEMI|nr:Hypothetical protein CINCED_3A014994 [Cinara cedri]